MQSPESSVADDIRAELELIEATEAQCRERRQQLLERAATFRARKLDIAAMFGVSKRQIEYARKRAGITTKPSGPRSLGVLAAEPKPGSKAARIVELLVTGSTQQKATLLTGYSRQLVEQTAMRWKRLIDTRRLRGMRAAVAT